MELLYGINSVILNFIWLYVINIFSYIISFIFLLSLQNIASGLLSVVEITLCLFFIILLGMIILNSGGDDELIIFPFEVSTGDEESKRKYEGKIIPNLLIFEINRIKSIQPKNKMADYPYLYLSNMILSNTADLSNIMQTPYFSEVMGPPSYVSNFINQDYFTTNTVAGSMTFSGVEFPLDSLMALIKKVFRKSSQKCITGCLEIKSSTYRLTATMQGKETYSWDIDGKEGYDFNDGIRDLAFKIYYDLLKVKNKEFNMKSWEDLKFFATSLSSYYKYREYGRVEDLDLSHRNCQLINKKEGTILFLFFFLGHAYLNESKYKTPDKYKIAMELFNDANNLDAIRSWALAGMAQCSSSLNESEKSKEFFQAALKTSVEKLKDDQNNSFELTIKAYCLYQVKKFDKSLYSFQELLKINKKLPGTNTNDAVKINKTYLWIWISACNYKLGNKEEAFNAIEEASNTNPKNSDLWSQKSVFLDNERKYDKALEACNRALELNPKNPEAWSSKGSILAHIKGKSYEAEKACEVAIQLRELPATFSAYGSVLGKNGNFDKAFDAHQKAIDKGRDQAYVWYNRSHTYYLKDDKDKFHSDLREALIRDLQLRDYFLEDPDFSGIDLEERQRILRNLNL